MISSSVSGKRKALLISLALNYAFALAPQMVQAEDGAVRLAGQSIFVNKAASGGLTVGQRADAIQKNLDNALVATKDRSPASVNIVYVKGVPVVTLGGYQVVTVDADNAKLANVTPAVLAQRWADSLKAALANGPSIDSYVAQLTGAYQSEPSPVAPATQMANYSQPPAYQSPSPNYAQTPPPAYNNAPPQYNQQPPAGYPPQGAYNQPYGQAPMGGQGSYDQYNSSAPSGGPMRQGRVVYAPAGTTIQAVLNTSLSTEAAKSGDYVQATVNQPIFLGDSQIPAGTVLSGQVTEAKHGGFLGIAGTLGIKFNKLRTPDGVETPISASISGGIGKYDENDKDVFRGETWKTKAGQAAIRGGIGAGTGAALGTAVGAIAGGGRGVGRGAWSGTAIGAGVGVASSLLLRKGKNVNIASGQPVEVRLDAPVSLSGNPYSGGGGAY